MNGHRKSTPCDSSGQLEVKLVEKRYVLPLVRFRLSTAQLVGDPSKCRYVESDDPDFAGHQLVQRCFESTKCCAPRIWLLFSRSSDTVACPTQSLTELLLLNFVGCKKHA